MEANFGRVREIKIEKGGWENTKKSLLVLLICFLTIYAPIELTRVIVAWGLAPQFIFEVGFLWLFYGLAIFTISARVWSSKKRRRAMIQSAIRCPNDMVMVFDDEGEQVPEYQGQYHEVKASILRDAPPEAIFGHWFDYEIDITTVAREKW